MPRYRKRPVVVEAEPWWQHGSGPAAVQLYRHPAVAGDSECRQCGARMDDHGWIDTLEGGHTVCPGDMVITGVRGEHYPCKPDIFAATYEEVSG